MYLRSWRLAEDFQFLDDPTPAEARVPFLKRESTDQHSAPTRTAPSLRRIKQLWFCD